MTTIAMTPALVAPARQAQIIVTLSETEDDRPANHVRVWVTVAPPGSELDGKLNKTDDPRNRVLVYEGGGGQAFPWRQSFDKGGKYTLVAQEYVRGGSGGPAYQSDPNAFDNETKAGAETELTLYVGQKVTQPIGPPSDRATLVIWVWNATIRETSVGFHGEASPAIVTTGLPTARVATAINAATVETALDALIGASVADAMGVIGDMVTNFIESWNSHLGDASVHANNDTNDNVIPVGYATALTPKHFQSFVNLALTRMRQHFTNNDGESGIDSSAYHEVGGDSVHDWTNMPLYESAGSQAEAVGGFSDLHRCHSAHRFSVEPTGVHQDVDAFPLDPLPPIYAVHSAFLAMIASSSPTAPAAQSTGVQLLVSGLGFSEG